jgi:hypothetical protein
VEMTTGPGRQMNKVTAMPCNCNSRKTGMIR